MFKNEKSQMMHQLSVSSRESKSILLVDQEILQIFVCLELGFEKNKISS